MNRRESIKKTPGNTKKYGNCYLISISFGSEKVMRSGWVNTQYFQVLGAFYKKYINQFVEPH